MKLPKYSMGVGDRFAHQAKPQLIAFLLAEEHGANITPVWNKSNREHQTIGSEPGSVRAAAARAVHGLRYEHPYFVDADHIRLETVDAFIDSSDFFTVDVADSIGTAPDSELLTRFIDNHPELIGTLTVAGIDSAIETTRIDIERIASKYLNAANEAGVIYRHILQQKDEASFITEVSMDETDAPQTPIELLVILAALADQQVPLQTIAPKFTGRFNKGVDYIGDVAKFEQEFSDDLAVISLAIKLYHLPDNLKLSVHSGSDKFSIYAPIRRALTKFNAGVHIKTAGTTWLEELIGLAEAGGAGLAIAQEIYSSAYKKREVLCAPYATVIDIDPAKLPTPAEVDLWTPEQYVNALRHDQKNPAYNPSFRQLLHVGYKIAAELGDRYLDLLDECEPTISENVTDNLFDRHIKPLFLDDEGSINK